MKAFVTGSTGLLGNNLVRLLLEQGHQVTALVRSRKKAAQQFEGLNVALVEGDLQDISGFASKMTGHDVLFHTAAYFREYYQPGEHWATLEAINVKGTIHLLTEAERYGVQKVIYVSSAGVIGRPSNGQPGDENTPPGPTQFENLYMKSKVLAERAIGEFLKTHTLPVVLILPTWIFGPEDAAPTGSGQLVLDFLNRKLPGIVAGGNMVVDARDVAQAMIHAVKQGQSGERYIVGGSYHSIESILQTLEKVSGIPAPKIHIPYAVTLIYAWISETIARWRNKPTLITLSGVRALNYRRETLSSEKAIRELGAQFRTLEETLRDEVQWYQKHQAHQLKKSSPSGQMAAGFGR